MKQTCLLSAITILVVMFTAVLLLEHALSAGAPHTESAPSRGNALVEKQAGPPAEPQSDLVPSPGWLLVSELLPVLVCGFFFLLGVVPIFLIDRDHHDFVNSIVKR
jgi:hypothetical protein